jgi:hypothetical protein
MSSLPLLDKSIIIDCSQDSVNTDPHNLLAVVRVIERMILPRFHPKKEDRDAELARLVDKFWEEHDTFIHHNGFFNLSHIWISAGRQNTLAHE